MERRCQHPAVAYEHGLAAQPSEHLHRRPGVHDPRCPDENAANGLRLALEVDVGLEARHLPSERVARHLDIEETKVRAVEEDHARTRPEERARARRNRLLETADPHEPADRGRLPARDDEPVQPSSCSGRRTSTVSTPSCRSMATCS